MGPLRPVVIACALVVLCAVTAAGCDPLGSMDFQGTYTLETINGKKLPVAASAASAAQPIQSGSVVLKYGGTFVSVITIVGENGQTTNREASGTYTVIPSDKVPGRFEAAPPLKMSFEWKGAGTTSASLDGRLLTVDIDGVRYTYRYASPPPR